MPSALYELRMSPAMKMLYSVVVVFGLLFAVGALGALAAGEASAEEVPLLLIGAVFFGGGAVFIARLMMTHAGRVEIGDEGIRLDCYGAVGEIPWRNFETAGVFRAVGAKYVGIRVRSLGEYIESGKRMSDAKQAGNAKLAQSFMRLMLAAKGVIPGALLNGAVALFGLSGMPKSSRNEDILQWNCENFGHHILIQAFWFANPGAVADEIVRRASANAAAAPPAPPAPAVETEPAPAGADVQPGYKKCPMCAETVREDAKICRFCRYSFEEDRFLDTS